MAIRVVSKGPAKEIEKEIVCKNCGATLSYVPRDVKSRHGTDYGGGPDGAEWIDCPECNSNVVIRSW